ncbi:wiskott-Aldrich syndrome protein family member 2 [Musa troglodytarum]|uniref:Wiskott-Aldrich syndrome protein family member 2 n=1 Tax=Musa troglodytarum TaxID=320322 RepID=A0A9E7L3W8_9LILI|nr:wiskott-Aldrich syndrome protein family member 2 [Musa troglodytarum]
MRRLYSNNGDGSSVRTGSSASPEALTAAPQISLPPGPPSFSCSSSSSATAMAAAPPREAPPPPPVIGKAGRYTVFITPPRAPKPSDAPSVSPQAASSVKVAPLPQKATPSPPPPPPVQVPPMQFEKPSAKSWGSVFAHSSLDEYLADWFGLNRSKYQWALNDYYENGGKASMILFALGFQEEWHFLLKCQS